MNTERREVVRKAAQMSLENLGSLAETIADAVEAAFTWESAPPFGVPTRWSCGCDSRECTLRRDQVQGTGADPYGLVRITCITHSLVGSSHPGRLCDGVDRLDAQAMIALDRAHQEQCR